MVTAGKNFSHQDRQGSSFFERNQVWRDQVESRIHSERNKEEKQMKRACKFKPEIRQSEKSYTQMLKHDDRRMLMVPMQQDPFMPPAPTEEIKGLSTHLQRQAVAKQRKMQEEEAFLLPSQKKQLQKMRIREAQHFYMQQNQYQLEAEQQAEYYARQ